LIIFAGRLEALLNKIEVLSVKGGSFGGRRRKKGQAAHRLCAAICCNVADAEERGLLKQL